MDEQRVKGPRRRVGKNTPGQGNSPFKDLEAGGRMPHPSSAVRRLQRSFLLLPPLRRTKNVLEFTQPTPHPIPPPTKFIPSSHLYWLLPDTSFPFPWLHFLPLWLQGHQLPTRFAPFCEGATSLSLAWVPLMLPPHSSCPSPSQDAWGAEWHEHAMVTLDQRGMNRWHPSFPHRMFWDLFCGFCRRSCDTGQRQHRLASSTGYPCPPPLSHRAICFLDITFLKKSPPIQASDLGSTLGCPSLDPSPSGWTCISKVEWEHDCPHFQQHVLQWAFQPWVPSPKPLCSAATSLTWPCSNAQSHPCTDFSK